MKVYDDFESGEMTCWKVLGLHVPLATVQINEVNQELELKQDEDDLKKVVHTLQPINKVRGEEVVPKEDEAYEELVNFDDGFLSGAFLRKRTVLQQMTDAKALASVVQAGGNALFSFISGVHSKLSARQVRYKVCRYAEILLSHEIRDSVQGDKYKWNVDAYLEFNRLSSKLQGEVAQQLAYACNFGPPEGFARISNWTRVIKPTEYDEFDGIHGDEMLKPLIASFNFAKRVGGAVAKPMLSMTQAFLKGRGSNSSSQNEFNDRIVHYLAECLVACRTRLDLCDCELSGKPTYHYV